MKKTIFIAAFAALALLSCSGNVQNPAGSSFDDVLLSRRSIRSYDASKSISEAQVRELLTATQEAPSWANQQPSKYYVAMSREKVAALQELIGPRNKENVAGAPVLVVSTFEKGKSGFFRGVATNEIGDGWGAYDNGLSNCYFILKAREMGFDTLIMGMRESDPIRSLFDIPEDEEVMAVIALGYRASDPAQPVHRPLDEIVKFF